MVSWPIAGGFRTQFDLEMNATEFKDAFDPSVRFIATDQITGIYSFLQAVRTVLYLYLCWVHVNAYLPLQLDWTEAWPYLCIAFHVTLFIVITSLRHHSTVQGFLFLGMRKFSFDLRPKLLIRHTTALLLVQFQFSRCTWPNT